LNKITFPTGGYIRYAWGPSTQPSDAISYASGGNSPPSAPNFNGCWGTYKAPAILHRYVSYDGVNIAEQQDFTYSTTISSGWTAKQTTVLTTDMLRTGQPHFQTTYSYTPLSVPPAPNVSYSVAAQVQLEHVVQRYDFNGALLSTTTKSWEGIAGNSVLHEEDTTLGNGMTSKVLYSHDNYNNVTEKDEYDLGQSSQARTTVYTYQGFPGRAAFSYTFPPALLDLLCKTVVHAGSSSGTPVAEADIYYDGGSVVCGTPATPSVAGVNNLVANTHDDANFGLSSTYSRGNATKVSQIGSTGQSPTTAFTFDETGQVVTRVDPCNAGCSDMAGSGHTTTYSYTDSYTAGTPSGNTNAYLTKITRPTAINGVAHLEQFSYDYNTGYLTKSLDENLQPTTYVYNTPPSNCAYSDGMNRLSEVDGADLGKTAYCYHDGTYNAAGLVPSVRASTLLNAGGQWKSSLSASDGLGHVVTAQELDASMSLISQVETSFDGEGKISTVSNPHLPSAPASSDGTTSYVYDSLGRTLKKTEPDHNTLQWCYDGVANWQGTANCGALVASSSTAGSVTGTWVDETDERSNHWQRASDGFGRLTQVEEPNGIAQSPSMKTVYNYDVLGNLLSVQQNGISGSTARSRSFTYDTGLSRLITSTNPETGTICYGAWSGSNCQNGYDLNGNLSAKTDARGVKVSYSYDNLNRLLGKTYSDGQTAIACYQYDTATIGVGRVSNAWTQPAGTSCVASPTSGTYLTLKSLVSYDAVGRLTSAQQRQCIGSTCSASSPYALTLAHDLAGNLKTLTNSVGAQGSPLTLTNYFDAANRPCLTTSSWASGFSPNLFQTNVSSGYAPPGGLQNWSLGSNSGTASSGCSTGPSSQINLQQVFDPRLRVTSFSSTGQIP